MNKWAEIIFGLILVLIVIVVAWYSASWGSFWNFRHAAWELLKGTLFWIIFFVGVLLILLGISDLKG